MINGRKQLTGNTQHLIERAKKQKITKQQVLFEDE